MTEDSCPLTKYLSYPAQLFGRTSDPQEAALRLAALGAATLASGGVNLELQWGSCMQPASILLLPYRQGKYGTTDCTRSHHPTPSHFSQSLTIPTSRNQSLGEGLPSWCWTPGTCPCEHWKADFRYPQACFPPVSAVKLDELNATCQVLNMPHHERAKWNRKKFMVTITGKSRINSPVEICRLGSKPQY